MLDPNKPQLCGAPPPDSAPWGARLWAECFLPAGHDWYHVYPERDCADGVVIAVGRAG